jgi:hypothetical protein
MLQLLVYSFRLNNLLSSKTRDKDLSERDGGIISPYKILLSKARLV